MSAALVVSAATPSFAAVTPRGITYDAGRQYAEVGAAKELAFTVAQTWNSKWSIVFSANAASLQNKNTELVGIGLGFRFSCDSRSHDVGQRIEVDSMD